MRPEARSGIQAFAGLFVGASSDGVPVGQSWPPLSGRPDSQRPAAGPIEIAGTPRAVQQHSTGAFCAVAGHIDNLADLAAALGIASPTPLSALMRAGPQVLSRFRGGFALAFWNPAAGSLTLASDPLGLRNVFYANIGGTLAFATDQRDMLSLPGLARDLNEAYLATFLSDGLPQPEDTLYTAIHRVPPGCRVTFRQGASPAHTRFWQLDLASEIRHARDEDYVEQGRALLDQAVSRHLSGPGPIVCQLSGGFDSSAVAATAARLRPGATIHALTSVPPPGIPLFVHPSNVNNEAALAQATARLYPNMLWEALSSDRLHRLDENPLRTFLTLSMPARNSLNIGWLAPTFDRARALGAQTMLTGEFGNMTLSWSGLSGLASWTRRGRWLRAGREAAALGRVQGRSAWRVLRSHAIKPLLSPAMQCRLSGQPGWTHHLPINPDFAVAHRIAEQRLEQGLGYDADTPTMRRNWIRRIQSLPPVMDRIGELLGVEVRDPTADLDLLEFCFAVPDDQYLRNGQTRWLARRVLADRLPPDVLNETRRGLQCPEYLHRITLQRDTIVDGLAALDRSPLASRALDLPKLKRLAADWPTDAANTKFNEIGAMLHRGVHFGQFLRWHEGSN